MPGRHLADPDRAALDTALHQSAVAPVRPVQGTAAKRAEQLRRMVGEYGQCSELAHVRVPLPLDPSVMLTGIIPEECSVFKSALSPLRLTFRTAGAITYACVSHRT